MSRNTEFVLIRHRQRPLALPPMLHLQLAALYVEHLDFTSWWKSLGEREVILQNCKKNPWRYWGSEIMGMQMDGSSS
jgi:hypothetical protein